MATSRAATGSREQRSSRARSPTSRRPILVTSGLPATLGADGPGASTFRFTLGLHDTNAAAGHTANTSFRWATPTDATADEPAPADKPAPAETSPPSATASPRLSAGRLRARR